MLQKTKAARPRQKAAHERSKDCKVFDSSNSIAVTGLGLSLRVSSLVAGKRIGAVRSIGAAFTWER